MQTALSRESLYFVERLRICPCRAGLLNRCALQSARDSSETIYRCIYQAHMLPKMNRRPHVLTKNVSLYYVAYCEYGRAKCMYCVELKLKVRRVARERYHQRHCGPVSNLNEHLGVVAALHKFGRRRTSRRVNVTFQNDRIKQLESAEFLTECGGTGRHSRGLFLRRCSVHGPIQIQNSFLKTFIPINFFQFFPSSPCRCIHGLYLFPENDCLIVNARVLHNRPQLHHGQ